jgi:hypothetical protein
VIICAFEDRATDIIGLKLLVCGLARHLPDVPVRICCPVATDEFRTWLTDYSQVTLDDSRELQGEGWNVKPILLQRLLAEGHESVVWMDSDIIVTSDFRQLFPDDDTLVVAHEPALTPYGVRQRAAGWHLPFGRALPGVNTCIVRAKSAHRELISAWQELLRHPEYTAARTVPFERRQAHLLGDQDVLLALLCSTEYAHVPVTSLRDGRAIIQHSGSHAYPPLHRIRHLFAGMPPLIHSQCSKPWRFPTVPLFRDDPGAYFACLYLEASPYAHFAREFRSQIPGFPQCLEIRTPLGKVSNTLSFGVPSLRGFTQATGAVNRMRLRRVASFVRRAQRKAYGKALDLPKRLSNRSQA